MIAEAALYLAAPDDRHAACLPVVGRPLAFRVVMAAVRAGVERITVPAALDCAELQRAITATPAARRRVVWVDAAAPAPQGPVLLLPATTLITAATLEPLVARPPTTAAVGAEATGAPLAIVSPAFGAALWPSITAGEPIGDAIRAAVATEAIVVQPAGLLERVGGAPDVARAESRLLAHLGSAIDTPLDTLVHRRLSRPVTRAAVALGVAPNTITLLSLAVGLGAIACVALATIGGAVAGLLLYAVAVVLDHADGEVARLTFAESRLGEWLDIAADTVVHSLLVAALGVAAQRVAGDGALAGLVGAAGVLGAAWLTKTSPRAAGPLGGTLNALGNRHGFYALLVLFLATRALRPETLPVLMLVVAAGTNAYWVGHVIARLQRR